jgi:uncharacterized membrane protein
MQPTEVVEEDDMKSTNVKAMVAKMFTVGLVAAAVVMAAPTKAQAQVAVGVRIGHERFIAPAYRRPYIVEPAPVVGFYGPTYYGPRVDFDRRWDRDRREEFFRHDDRRFDRR